MVQGFELGAIQAHNHKGGWGLPGMNKRAADLGANLTVNSQPGVGTRI